MYHHGILEGVVKKLEIAVGLTVEVADADVGAALEESGIREADGKTARIFAQVAVDGVEIAGRGENLVVEAFVEHMGKTGPIVDRHFEESELSAEDFIETTFHRQEDMQMVRHEGILQDAQCRMDGGDFAETILDSFAERRSFDVRAAGRAGGDAPIAG